MVEHLRLPVKPAMTVSSRHGNHFNVMADLIGHLHRPTSFLVIPGSSSHPQRAPVIPGLTGYLLVMADPISVIPGHPSSPAPTGEPSYKKQYVGIPTYCI